MSLQSIERKKAELAAARAEMTSGRSAGKKTLIRVRTGLLVGGVLLVVLEVAMKAATENTDSTVFGYVGALMIVAWLVLLFAGMFVA